MAMTNSTTTFHLFPLLPSELRLKVWNLALSISREITVICERERLLGTRRFKKSFRSQTAVPALLHTCRESRLEGFLTYKPMFQTEYSSAYIYVSFDNDTIKCVDSSLEHIGDDELERVQRLIVDVNDEAYFAHFHVDVLIQMGMLRDLELLVLGENVSWYRGRRYMDGMVYEMEQARKKNPTWVCPYIRIVQKTSGKELGVIPGGPLQPEELEDIAGQTS
jgi:hypothetical protein